MAEIKSRDFLKKLKNEDIEGKKVLIHGEEAYLTNQIIKALKEKNGIEKIYIDDNNFLEKLSNLSSGNSLFSEKREIPVIIGAEKLTKTLRKKREQELFFNFCKKTETFFLVSFEKLDRKTLKTAFFKQLLKITNTTVLSDKFDRNKLFSILKKKFKKNNKEIDDETILFIIETVGTDLQNLKVETDKIADYPGNLTKDVVSELLFSTPATDIFSLINYYVKDEKRKFLKNATTVLSDSEPLKLLALMQTQLRQIIEIKSGSNVRLPQYVIRHYRSLGINIPLAKLYGKLKKLHEAEFSIKTGKKKPKNAVKELILEEY